MSKINTELLIKLHNELDDWKDIVATYNDMTGEKRTRSTLTCNFSRNKPIDSQPKSEIIKDKKIMNRKYKKGDDFQKSVEHRSDGTIRIINVLAMDHDEKKNNDYILQAHGYDTELYYIHSITLNEWGNKSDYDKQNYQVKLDVRPKQVKNLSLKDINNIESTYTYKHKPITLKKEVSNNAFVVHLTDMHIGDDNTLEHEYLEIAKQIKHDINKNEYEKLYLCFNGDILHVDNVSKTTDRGTQLEMSVSAYDMYRTAKDILIQIISTVAIIETEIYWVQGNHSRLAEFALFNGIQDAFTDNKHITMDVSETKRKAFLVYDTLIGIFHGDLPKKQHDKWLMFEYAPLWGKATAWEQVSGHIHQEGSIMYGGLQHNIHGTKNGVGDYAYGLGYGNYTSKVKAYGYNAVKGKTEVRYY